MSTGTGIIVSAQGDILTNAHVVDGCSKVTLQAPGQTTPARIMAYDKTNDLALLNAPIASPKFAKFRSQARLGEGIAAFGYPLTNILASSGNFTLGNITAVSGMVNDSRYYQISAPVQPGNSGGPLVDMSGNLVGVVSAKLNAIKIMEATGSDDIAQNVNFAIKAAVAQTFLEGNNVKIEAGALGPSMQPADLAEAAKATSVYILCHQ